MARAGGIMTNIKNQFDKSKNSAIGDPQKLLIRKQRSSAPLNVSQQMAYIKYVRYHQTDKDLGCVICEEERDERGFCGCYANIA